MVSALLVGPMDRCRMHIYTLFEFSCWLLVLPQRIQFGRIQRVVVVVAADSLIGSPRLSASARRPPRARGYTDNSISSMHVLQQQRTRMVMVMVTTYVRVRRPAAQGSYTWQIHRNRSLSLFRVCYSICTCTVLVPSETSSVAR